MTGTKIFSYLILTISVIYSLILPTYADVSHLMKENGEYRNTIESIQTIDNKIIELDTKMKDLDEQVISDINVMLPDSLNLVRLVSEIDNIASRHGIKIDNISSLEKDLEQEEENALVSKSYNSALISFSFSSDYVNFMRFISELETSLRVMNIRSLQIRPDGEGLVYEYNIQYDVYWLP